MSRKRALELCDEVDDVPDEMNAMAYHNRAISLLKMAIRELCKEPDKDTRILVYEAVRQCGSGLATVESTVDRIMEVFK